MQSNEWPASVPVRGEPAHRIDEPAALTIIAISGPLGAPPLPLGDASLRTSRHTHCLWATEVLRVARAYAVYCYMRLCVLVKPNWSRDDAGLCLLLVTKLYVICVFS